MERNTVKAWESLGAEDRPGVRYWLPGAAVNEEDLREEIRSLKRRGFGRIEVVSMAVHRKEMDQGEDSWGTENWERVLCAIADETEKQGLLMDVANGPGWPISAPSIQNAGDPAALQELTFGVADGVPGELFTGTLPGRRVVHEEVQPKLIAAMAYLETGEKILKRESYINLQPYAAGNQVSIHLPEADGTWKLFAFYQQGAAQVSNAGKGYVIDHFSRAGVEACEKYWSGVFGKYTYPSMESLFCDSLEYRVSLEWTFRLPEVFREKKGYDLLPFLPVIGQCNEKLHPTDLPGYRFEEDVISRQINRDYFDVLTDLYCEEHLTGLERMANRYGKTVRYQVGYNKPLEVERSALCPGIPENEGLGRPSMDYLKTMAAAAHMGRKKRYSFECAAEFGHTYDQSYEDLFWWIKRSSMAGMNAQVLHGASYSGRYDGKYSENGKIPGTAWPGYEAFGKGCSNYWNRTLSEKDARGCLDAVTRMNRIFRQKARVDCLIFRSSYRNEGEGSEFCLYLDDGRLQNLGYSYEFASEKLLELPVCQVQNGVLDPDGAAYHCLIIMPEQTISFSGLQRIRKLSEDGLCVLWVGEGTHEPKFYMDQQRKEPGKNWEQLYRELIWEAREEKRYADRLEQVPELLKKKGLHPRMELDGKNDVATAVREMEGRCYYILYGYNRVVFAPEEAEKNKKETLCSGVYRKGTTKGTYERPGRSSRKKISVKIRDRGTVFVCDPWSGKKRKCDTFETEEVSLTGTIDLEEDELVIFEVEHSENDGGPVGLPLRQEKNRGMECKVIWNRLSLQAFEADEMGESSFLRSGFHGKWVDYHLMELLPWCELSADLEHFSGRGLYRGKFLIDAPKKDEEYILHLGHVSDTFTVKVNGIPCDFPDQVMKRVVITDQVREGENELEVLVYGTLYNCLYGEKNGEETGFSLEGQYEPGRYGIWEDEDHPVEIEIKAK